MNVLCIDLGLKRIGIALLCENTVVPLDPIQRKNRNQAASELSRILHERRIDLLVIGIPIGGSSEEEMRRRAQHFSSLLDYHGKIDYEDETDSSLEAESLIKGVRRNAKDGKTDSLAAKIILERWKIRTRP